MDAAQRSAAAGNGCRSEREETHEFSCSPLRHVPEGSQFLGGMLGLEDSTQGEGNLVGKKDLHAKDLDLYFEEDQTKLGPKDVDDMVDSFFCFDDDLMKPTDECSKNYSLINGATETGKGLKKGPKHERSPSCGALRGPPLCRPSASSIPSPMTYPDWFCTFLMGSFPTKTLGKGTEGAGACAVCQCDYAPKDTVVQTPCKHLFHRGCLKPWLSVNITCPQCRFDLSELCTSGNSTNAPWSSQESAMVEKKQPGSIGKEKPEDVEAKELGNTLEKEDMVQICVDKFDTGLTVKQKLEEATKIPVRMQRLIAKGKEIPDHTTLESIGIVNASDLEMIPICGASLEQKVDANQVCKRQRVQ